MDELMRVLDQRRGKLSEMIAKIEMKVPNYPEGRLRIANGRKQLRYYRVDSSTDRLGQYIPKSDIAQVKLLAQKGYDKEFLKVAKRELAAMEECLEQITKYNSAEVFQNMSKYRKKLVVPRRITNELYAKRWEQKSYNQSDYMPDNKKYTTRKGDLVRSKSEILIADMLYELKIPYRYEQSIVLRDGTIFNPDFTLLDIYTREEVYWEHFGMMDDDTYMNDALYKINKYRENGIGSSNNLIATFESMNNPFDPQTIRKMLVDRFCR